MGSIKYGHVDKCQNDLWAGYVWRAKCLRTRGHEGLCTGRKSGQRHEWTLEAGAMSKARAMAEFLSR